MNEKNFNKLLAIPFAFSLSIIIIFSFFCFGLNRVEAQVLPSPDSSFLWAGNINTTPTDTWFLGSNNSIREDFFVFNMRAKSFPMTYIVLTWCTSNIGMIEDMYISNTNYTNNFINDGKGVTYITGDSCTYNSYEGWIVKKQFVVGKWEKIEDIDDVEFGQTAGGYLNFKNHYNWNVFYQLTDFYLSDTDDLTTLSEAQNNLRETIDAIEEQTTTITENQNQIKDAIIANNNANTDKQIQENKNLLQQLFDFLVGLFIPDSFDFLTGFLDVLEEKLGFVGSVPIQFFEFLIDLVNVDFDTVTSITLPHFEILGYTFFDEQEIDLTDIMVAFEPYRVYTNIGCVCLCIRYLIKLYETFANGEE